MGAFYDRAEDIVLGCDSEDGFVVCHAPCDGETLVVEVPVI
jgi:hypothetical protein